ncbi:hypothetical protein [Shimia aestuarii]|uniref:Uncharacterized protein n=1 Tax=Shimia aestuarii TaxID=254406 RepID=A0A1I4T5U4_9RHOB|nr:hypothetical protein [Shimia aestuarii]SFM72059.1 hypothetical protein SAMN04488042_1146 [Shimia aestuarii]
MTLEEIKAAVDAGLIVHWANTGYRVHRDGFGQYLITFLPNGSTIGLTDRSGQRLNGDEAQFFIAKSEDCNGPNRRGHPIPDEQGGAQRPAERGHNHLGGSSDRGEGKKGKKAFWFAIP